ncbi:hypothetical protein KGF54_005261 [Candida jiufengensis]|uniref:uncharacterized protein n=1 Tax=Candida jiufengensis TaxID=497108 RepID=UPI0022245B2C|nr:uncharacterized protein KGF54_005261 [Candida jiufengensis]KAI5950113.1 hypothetical protein KGF54_005261 [Candida jiufengensis]
MSIDLYESYGSSVTVSDIVLVSEDSVETNGGGIDCLPNEGQLNIWFSKIILAIDEEPYETIQGIQNFNEMMCYYLRSILNIIHLEDNVYRFTAFMSNNRMDYIIKIISSNINEQGFIFSEEPFKDTYRLVCLILHLLRKFEIKININLMYGLLDSLLNLRTLKLVAKKDAFANVINNLINKILNELVPAPKLFELVKVHLSACQQLEEVDFLVNNVMSLAKSYLEHVNILLEPDNEQIKLLFREIMVLLVDKNYHNLNKLNYSILKQQFRKIKAQFRSTLNNNKFASLELQNSDFYQYNSSIVEKRRKIKESQNNSREEQQEVQQEVQDWVPSFINGNNLKNIEVSDPDDEQTEKPKSRNPLKKLFKNESPKKKWFHFHKNKEN